LGLNARHPIALPFCCNLVLLTPLFMLWAIQALFQRWQIHLDARRWDAHFLNSVR
jgi:hypothetical protein